ncbi:MAG: hypothetical protein R6U17_01825 [Thermoplasmata archaeon]
MIVLNLLGGGMTTAASFSQEMNATTGPEILPRDSTRETMLAI